MWNGYDEKVICFIFKKHTCLNYFNKGVFYFKLKD